MCGNFLDSKWCQAGTTFLGQKLNGLLHENLQKSRKQEITQKRSPPQAPSSTINYYKTYKTNA